MTALTFAHRLRSISSGGMPATHTSTKIRAAESRYLIASGLSFLGDWLTTVVVTLTLYRLMGPSGPGAYMLARVAPRPVGARFGGRLADNVGPSPVLLGLMLAQMIATVAMLLATAASQPALLLAAVALAQLCGAAAVPARISWIAGITDPPLRARLMGQTSSLAATSMIVAAPLGSLLLFWLTASAVIAVDVVTFAVAALLISGLSLHPKTRPGHASEPAPGGATLLLRSRPLRRLAVAAVGNFAVITLLQALLAEIAHDHFGGGGALGVLYGAVGMGAVCGGSVAARRPPTPTLISALVLIECAAAVIAAVVSPLPLALVCLMICGAAGAGYQVGASLWLVSAVAAERVGSASGALTSLGYVGMGIGALVAVVAAPHGVVAMVPLATVASAALLISTMSDHRHGGVTS